MSNSLRRIIPNLRTAAFARTALLASLMLSLAVCQVQGRRFFLSRIWQGSAPEGSAKPFRTKFSLTKAPAAVAKSVAGVERPADQVLTLPEAVSASHTPVSHRMSLRHFRPAVLLPVIRLSAGRSPPR